MMYYITEFCIPAHRGIVYRAKKKVHNLNGTTTWAGTWVSHNYTSQKYREVSKAEVVIAMNKKKIYDLP